MDLDDIAARLERLEEAVGRIMARLGMTAGGSELEARVTELIARGRKIEAIKIWREATGVGLREAKDAVEAIEARERID